MKKNILFFLLLTWIVCPASAKYRIDTIIHTKAYISHVSLAAKSPMMVTYKLYHAGGDCDRSAYHFINDTKLDIATKSDYYKSGYDQGHMADAEDFAYDCMLDESTFRFYNCIPQTPNLNRGVWRSWENTIRKESQTDSVFVLCGGIYDSPSYIGDSIPVPTRCWKVVQSLSTGAVTHCMVFTNTSAATMTITTTVELEKTLGYKLPLKNTKTHGK